MKFFYLFFDWILVAFCCFYLFDLNAATDEPSSTKQSISWERCPQNQCEEYARDKMSRLELCADFELRQIFGRQTIVWEYCGVVICGDVYDYYIPTRMNLSKPYPDCCPICLRED